MEIPVTQKGAVACVEVGPALDYRCAQAYKEACADLITSGVKYLGFDLSRCLRLDSRGLGVLFFCYRQISPVEGKVALAGVSEPIRAALDLVQLQRILSYFATRGEAERWLHRMAA